MSRARALIVIILALATAALAGASSAAAETAGCDEVISPGGARDVNELLASLAPGETGCLRSGTYIDDQFRIKTPDITLTSYPGEHATARGRLRIEATADGAVVEGLTLDGRNPQEWLGPLIYADRVILRQNDIFNLHTAICVHIDQYSGYPRPRDVVIEGNRIHDCGDLPATNQHHGIYISHAEGTVIRENWIYSNADRGIQLYSDADGSVITGNVIDGNGQGILFAGDRDDASDDNLVENNVITNSTIRYNIESHWQGPRGVGNVARGNCVWTTRSSYRGKPDGSGIGTESGFAAMANVVASPAYENRSAGMFNIPSDKPCWRMLGEGSAPASGKGPFKVRLKARSRAVPLGASLKLRGRVRSASVTRSGTKAVVQLWRGGGWEAIATERLVRRRFSAEPRVETGTGELYFRARVRGVGRSRPLSVTVLD